MGIVAWIAIAVALGVTSAALYRTSPPRGRALVILVAAVGGVLGGLIGTAASDASITTFFAVAPWLTAALGALAGIGIHNEHARESGRTDRVKRLSSRRGRDRPISPRLADVSTLIAIIAVVAIVLMIALA